jgi:hypothetical protein
MALWRSLRRPQRLVPKLPTFNLATAGLYSFVEFE